MSTPDTRRLRITIIATACIIPVMFLWAPMVMQVYATRAHLAPATIGRLFSLDMFTASVPGVLAFLWERHIGWRKMAYAMIGVFAAGSVASAWLIDHGMIGWLMACRVPTALASGTLYLMCNRSVVRLDNPDQTFGLMMALQVVLATMGFIFMPFLFGWWGAGAGFLVQALWIAGLFPLFRHFPPTAPGQGAREMPGDPAVRNEAGLAMTGVRMAGVGAVLAMFLFNVATGGIWTFSSVIMESGHISVAATHGLLVVVGSLGILGSGSAALASRVDAYRTQLIAGGFVALCGAVGLAAMAASPLPAGLAVLGFKLAWTFLLPFMMGTITMLDRTGALMNVTSATLGIGLACGPLLAGPVLDHAGLAAMALAMGAIALAAGLMSLPLSTRALRAARPQPARFSREDGVQAAATP